MDYTEIEIGGILLTVSYTYDPGRPASGPYAPEYPTLEVGEIALIAGKLVTSLFLTDLIEAVGGMETFKILLLRHLERVGELR